MPKALTLTQRYLIENGGSRRFAVRAFVKDLMQDVPDKSLAVAEAQEYWGMSEQETNILEADLNEDSGD